MFSRRFRLILIFVLGCVAAANGLTRLQAAAPTLTQFYPVAVSLGVTTKVTAVGKFDPWPVDVWTDTPGITFEADKKAGEYNVSVAADVPAGPHLVRLFNATGVSVPRFLVVTAQADAAETEPNDHFRKAPPVATLPVTIQGRLGKSGDVDSFAIELAAGQTLLAAVEANVLASPIDAVLRLVDTRGVEVALNHDRGRALDPFLTWTAKTAGTYVLQVFGFAQPATAEVKFAGSDACVYRLHLSSGPQVRHTLPLGIQRDQTARRRVEGWNLDASWDREFDLTDLVYASDSARATWRNPAGGRELTLPVGMGPEWMESDLRAQPADQPPASSPFAITGAIARVGEEDRFRFNATKGDKLVLQVNAAVLGFPLDAWLAIENAAGKELVRNDDASGADPVLEWTAPATGTYVAVVGSVLQRAGADHLYRLSLEPAAPRFVGVVADAGFTLEPGKTAKIKVTARRIQGFKSKLKAVWTGLPEGITASPWQIGATDKDVTLELVAAAEVAPFSGPVVLHFNEEDSDLRHPGIYELVSTTLNNGVPQGFRELVIPSTHQLWLTVLAAPSAKEAAEVKNRP